MLWIIVRATAAAGLLTLVALTSPWWMTLCVCSGASFWAMQGTDDDEEDEDEEDDE